MDLGIAGRKAIVCASSRGLGYGCAMALAQAGCEVVINGRDEKRSKRAAAEIARGHRRQGHPGRGRCRHARGPEGVVRRLPGARHPGQQQCRPAVARFPRTHPPADDRRRDRQHGGRDRTDPEGDRPDDREEIRPHRQHHLGLGEACRWPGSTCPRARARASPRSSPASRVRSRPPTSPSISSCPAPSTPTGCARTSRATPRSKSIPFEQAKTERMATGAGQALRHA